MSLQKVKEYFETVGIKKEITEFDTSTATVELAAEAIGCVPARIAKTMAFFKDESCILIVTSGDTKIDNAKFKSTFGVKAKMVPFENVEEVVGHAAGGVCPFGVNEGVKVYLDASLKRFDTVFPACGSHNSVAEFSISELEKYSNYISWVDVCRER